jgi:hypothetical protein
VKGRADSVCMTPTTNITIDDHAARTVAREVAMRATAAVGLAGIALIHLLDSIGKYHETRYVFWMYVALMLGSVATAGAVLISHRRIVWSAAAALATSAIAGYVISRTTGLPNATDDIGNWTEPLGLASLFVEGCVVALSVVALRVSAETRTALRRLRTVAVN